MATVGEAVIKLKFDGKGVKGDISKARKSQFVGISN